MAADENRWLFTKDQIRNAPSVSNGSSCEEEQLVRKNSCTFVAEIGQNLVHPASILAINCAKVFLHRFYMMESIDLSDTEKHKLIAVTCMFVACKSEECLRPLKEFIWSWNNVDAKNSVWPFGRYAGDDTKRKPWQIDENIPMYQDVRERIFACERDLLHSLGYDFFVDYPHSYVVRFTRFFDRVKRDKESRSLVVASEDHDRFTDFGTTILTTAHAMANDAMSSFLSIQYRASLIGVVCVSLSLRTHGFKAHSAEKWIKKWNEERIQDPDPRFQAVIFLKEDYDELCNQLLDMYDEIQRQSAAKALAEAAAAAQPAQHLQHTPSTHREAPSAAAVPSTNAMAQAAAEPTPASSAGPEVTSNPPRPASKGPPSAAAAPPAPEMRERLEAGETVNVAGSGPKPYLLQRKGNVYSCNCSVWRHIEDIEQRRTCKHLRLVRGERAETGRVGEEGIRKSEEKLRELLEADVRARQLTCQKSAAAPPAHLAHVPTASVHSKRPAEGGDAPPPAKRLAMIGP